MAKKKIKKPRKATKSRRTVKSRKRETGWKSMPGSMKFAFVYMIISLVIGVVNIPVIFWKPIVTFMGYVIQGIPAILIQIISTLALFLVVYSIYKRKKYTWAYGMILYGIFAVMVILGLFRIDNMVGELMMTYPPEAFPNPVTVSIFLAFMKLITRIGLIIGLIMSIIMIILFYRARNYFN